MPILNATARDSSELEWGNFFSNRIKIGNQRIIRLI